MGPVNNGKLIGLFPKILTKTPESEACVVSVWKDGRSAGIHSKVKVIEIR